MGSGIFTRLLIAIAYLAIKYWKKTILNFSWWSVKLGYLYTVKSYTAIKNDKIYILGGEKKWQSSMYIITFFVKTKKIIDDFSSLYFYIF